MKLHVARFGTPGMPRQLWLHGFLGRGENWRETLEPWADRYEFLCPDLPGHGSTPWTGEGLGATLEAIAHLAKDCLLAGGYSMGGRLLMMSAARHGDAFQTLVVESAALGYADPAERASRRDLDASRARRLLEEGLPAFVRDWYAAPAWNSLREDEGRFAKVLADRSQGDAAGLAAAMEAFGPGHQPDLRQWLRYTHLRILWLAGGRDSTYVAEAEEVRQRMPRVRVGILPGAGHNAHLEQPGLWRNAVGDFIQSQHLKDNQAWQQ
jgi:2-succinyl-6-hydroxy-2,4-cyclohexadiene-1-carboxylate synthase